jgi:hypothetical protein
VSAENVRKDSLAELDRHSPLFVALRDSAQSEAQVRCLRIPRDLWRFARPGLCATRNPLRRGTVLHLPARGPVHRKGRRYASKGAYARLGSSEPSHSCSNTLRKPDSLNIRCTSPSSTEPEGFHSGPRAWRAAFSFAEASPRFPRFQSMKPRRNLAFTASGLV